MCAEQATLIAHPYTKSAWDQLEKNLEQSMLPAVWARHREDFHLAKLSIQQCDDLMFNATTFAGEVLLELRGCVTWFNKKR